MFQENEALHYLLYFCQNVANFQNFVTHRLGKKFATKPSLNFSPHLKGVTTLPCKILFLKKLHQLMHCNWCNLK